MDISLNDLRSQYINYKEYIDHAIQKVLDSSQFIMGQEVYQFENALAQFLECKHVISCCSGTGAILLALKGIDILPGDEVITTPLTFMATAEAIALLGATPVFADIQIDTYNIDPNEIAKKITAKTKAIIAVSLHGQPAEMDEINAIAAEFGKKFGNKIYVIEDAAQSLGAVYKGKKSTNLSDLACTSFFPSKPLGCYGDGGAVMANDDALAEKIKSLRVHGQSKRYYHKYIGFNGRLDTIQAAILLVKLNYFKEELKNRDQIANYYYQLLKNKNVILPHVKQNRTSVYAQFVIRVKHREQVIASLKNKHIATGIHFPQPLHLQECFRYLGYQLGNFPIAEKVANEILSIPMGAYLTKDEQKYIVNAIVEALETEALVAIV